MKLGKINLYDDAFILYPVFSFLGYKVRYHWCKPSLALYITKQFGFWLAIYTLTISIKKINK